MLTNKAAGHEFKHKAVGIPITIDVQALSMYVAAKTQQDPQPLASPPAIRHRQLKFVTSEDGRL